MKQQNMQAVFDNLDVEYTHLRVHRWDMRESDYEKIIANYVEWCNNHDSPGTYCLSMGGIYFELEADAMWCALSCT